MPTHSAGLCPSGRSSPTMVRAIVYTCGKIPTQPAILCLAVENKPTMIYIRGHSWLPTHPTQSISRRQRHPDDLYQGAFIVAHQSISRRQHLQHAFPPAVTLTTLPTERKISAAAFILQIFINPKTLLAVKYWHEATRQPRKYFY